LGWLGNGRSSFNVQKFKVFKSFKPFKPCERFPDSLNGWNLLNGLNL